MTKYKNLKWMVFWKWLCLWENEKRWKYIYEKCECLHCWEERFVYRGSLYGWRSTYCWKRIKHWMSWTRFYQIWLDMKQRCNNGNQKVYKWYWGKWIKIEWNKFEDFMNDMYESYLEHVKLYWEKQTTIDRIDGDKNYCKENCRWATLPEQAINKKRVYKIEYKWKQYNTLMELALDKWINYNSIRTRLRNWWDIEKIIETPFSPFRERDSSWKFISVNI